MAKVHSADLRQLNRADISISDIGIADLVASLKQGWDDFLNRRGDLILIGLIYPIGAAFGILFALEATMLPLVFPLLAGSALLGPILASGYYEIARRRARGQDASTSHFFNFLKGERAFQIVSLASILCLLFAAWVLTAFVIYSATVGSLPADQVNTISAFIRAVFTTPEGIQMLVLGNLVGLGFALVALAISLVSFPMLIDRDSNWADALHTSVRLAWRNPFATISWGLIVAALLVLGSIPAFIGLAVVLPVLGYASWHLYRRAVP